jgi:FlaA1/EpsC-like NDP-sugar epimerase
MIRIKDIDVTEILGRKSVEPREDLMSNDIEGKSVMVTGAGGSIGSELCRQIVKYNPSCLVLFEINEYALYTIEVELKRIAPHIKTYSVLGSVRNESRVFNIVKRFAVKVLYHSAAYKHVPMVEYNICEGIMNNLIGTANCLYNADEAGIEKFVLISTDKAVRPTNVMGASKRLAEMFVQAIACEYQENFSMVRFGNVLGSSGSVVPLFMEQIARKEPLTITHPDITRYFMSIPEAAQLVIQAGAIGEGGEVFVLDMGKPVKIIDMAKSILKFYREDENRIIITGLRPGEKLYEELLIGNNVSNTNHPMIMKAKEDFIDLSLLYSKVMLPITQYCEKDDIDSVMSIFSEFVDGFNHNGDIKDHNYSGELKCLNK